MFTLIVFFSNPVMAWNYYAIWNSNPATRGQINYTGVSGGIVNTSIGNLPFGTSTITYCMSSGGVATVYYGAISYAAVIPQSLSISGVDIPITATAATGQFFTYNTDTLFVQHDPGYNESIPSAQCRAPGYSYNFGSMSLPKINLTLSIPNNLPIGRYTGNVPVKYSLSDPHATSSSELRRPTNDEFYRYTSAIISVPYDINITGSCSVDASQITIPHGALTSQSAQDHEKQISASVLCSTAANVSLELSTNTPSAAQYTNSLGVDLGNGWNSALKIINNTNGQQGTSVKVNAIENTKSPIIISSTLKSTSNAQIGTLNGSATLTIIIQ